MSSCLLLTGLFLIGLFAADARKTCSIAPMGATSTSAKSANHPEVPFALVPKMKPFSIYGEIMTGLARIPIEDLVNLIVGELQRHGLCGLPFTAIC